MSAPHHEETGLLCDEGHVPQIAKAMATLVSDAALRQRYGTAARLNALEHFNIARLNDQLAELIREKSRSIAETRVARPVSQLPLISVCIPTCNRAAYIGDCLRSVLDQADGRVEVLVIDDGSNPLTVLEALSARVPVIATDVGGVREIVQEDVDGLIVPPHSADAIGAAMARFMADPSMVRRIRSTIRPVKTIKMNAREYERLYARGAVARHRVGRG